ncbi:UNVERIFIED_CONTAM: hypothetical protein RMT77_007355 [Armadillidium vulgare]
MEGAKVEHTLAMIKPDAVSKIEQIEEEIHDAGFTILQKKHHTLTKEEAEEFYAEHEGKPFFETLIEYMTSGAVVAMVLSKKDAIAEWRKFLGPTKVSVALEEAPESFRARYGDPDNDSHNAGHGSDSEESAQREIQFFFPQLTLEPPTDEEGAKDYLNFSISPTLVRGLSELCKEKPGEPAIWLADWLLKNNPNNNRNNSIRK